MHCCLIGEDKSPRILKIAVSISTRVKWNVFCSTKMLRRKLVEKSRKEVALGSGPETWVRDRRGEGKN